MWISSFSLLSCLRDKHREAENVIYFTAVPQQLQSQIQTSGSERYNPLSAVSAWLALQFCSSAELRSKKSGCRWSCNIINHVWGKGRETNLLVSGWFMLKFRRGSEFYRETGLLFRHMNDLWPLVRMEVARGPSVRTANIQNTNTFINQLTNTQRTDTFFNKHSSFCVVHYERAFRKTDKRRLFLYFRADRRGSRSEQHEGDVFEAARYL